MVNLRLFEKETSLREGGWYHVYKTKDGYRKEGQGNNLTLIGC
jgi:hypothetical protein